MSKAKALMYRLMPKVSSLALLMAITIIGKSCRGILYQPKVPQRLLDMDR